MSVFLLCAAPAFAAAAALPAWADTGSGVFDGTARGVGMAKYDLSEAYFRALADLSEFLVRSARATEGGMDVAGRSIVFPGGLTCTSLMRDYLGAPTASTDVVRNFLMEPPVGEERPPSEEHLFELRESDEGIVVRSYAAFSYQGRHENSYIESAIRCGSKELKSVDEAMRRMPPKKVHYADDGYVYVLVEMKR